MGKDKKKEKKTEKEKEKSRIDIGVSLRRGRESTAGEAPSTGANNRETRKNDKRAALQSARLRQSSVEIGFDSPSASALTRLLSPRELWRAEFKLTGNSLIGVQSPYRAEERKARRLGGKARGGGLGSAPPRKSQKLRVLVRRRKNEGKTKEKKEGDRERWLDELRRARSNFIAGTGDYFVPFYRSARYGGEKFGSSIGHFRWMNNFLAWRSQLASPSFVSKSAESSFFLLAHCFLRKRTKRS